MNMRATLVAVELEGSAQSLSDVATPEEMNNMQFCRALDALVLCCVSCGWWVPTDESITDSGEALCLDCASTEADES